MEWNSSNFGMEIQSNELNCTPEQQQLSNSFFNPNWDNSMDQGDPFESALSSIVSSPAASSVAGGVVSGESFVLRELIGRLGSICKSGGEVTTPKSYTGGHNSTSTNNSCYTTPLNSPPKLNLSDQIRGNFQFPFPHNNSSVSFLADPGFTERAARFSQFGLNETEFTFPPRLNHPVVDECGNLSNSGSEKKFRRISRSSTPPENGEFGDSRENSSVSEQIPVGEIGMKAQNIGIGRKRKSIPRGKGKEAPKSSSPSKVVVVAGESEESNSKRNKSDDENGKEKEDSEEKEEQKGNGKSRGEGKENEKTQEPPKDYIHVRARRGQATDSHSLAERVRREKISERMKFLQDLVPGCNKVTGKAVMLDEIINYVQSLQRQVEFLSMKLSTVNPRMDFNMEALLSKNILQSGGSMAHSSYPIENSAAPAFPYGYQSLVHSGISNGMDTSFSMKPLPHIDGFREVASQASTFWEDDLQSFVQMGFNQNQQQSFSGAMATTHMKVEL